MATKNVFYAAIGAGDMALETARKTRDRLDLKGLRKDLPKRVTALQSDATKTAKRLVKQSNKQYDQLATRGQQVVKSVRSSVKTRRAVDQAKTAKSQTKAAATSTKKAATATVEAAKSATSNI